MKLVVARACQSRETRVALIPSVVGKLRAMGLEIRVQAGAGLGAHHADPAYAQAGSEVVSEERFTESLAEADVVVCVGPLADEQVAKLRPGAVLIGQLAPLKNLAQVQTLMAGKITSFSLEFIPRITRAQSMDALSSQANIAGYKAVLLAAAAAPKIFPMMMTAAGTIAPSKVFVIGAGVAGLQAIATAKRLGAVVEAFDVRAVVKEQVQSLGARFVELPLNSQDAQTQGGYAKELTPEQQQQQRELMAKHVIGADAVITTAAVFGKAPPMLIPTTVVQQMRAGAVIVDLAADEDAGRGNCQATQPGRRITTEQGVIIDGTTNLPALAPVHASQAYANNLLAFLKELLKDGQLRLNLEDEIQKGALITHDGQITNELVRRSLAEKPGP